MVPFGILYDHDQSGTRPTQDRDDAHADGNTGASAGTGALDPGRTIQRASGTLVSAYRLIIDFLIWIFVVILPIFGPPILLIWPVVWLLRRRNRGATKGQGA